MEDKQTSYKCISVAEASTMLNTKGALFIDIRDDSSFSKDHIPNAIHLTENNLDSFIKKGNRDNYFIVYCYHGNSSKEAAKFLKEQGYKNIYSLNGGFSEYKRLKQ